MLLFDRFVLTTTNLSGTDMSLKDMSVSEMPMFKNVETGGLYIDVDSYSRTPFSEAIKVTRTGVLRFVSIFFVRSATNIRPALAGLSCGSDTAVVLKLEEKDHHLIDEYLKAEEHTEADAQNAVRFKKNMVRDS